MSAIQSNHVTELGELKGALEDLEGRMRTAIEAKADIVASVHPDQRISALNLIRYLTLRSEDIRGLQDALHVAGLSSMASSESHILRQVQAIRERLGVRYSAESIAALDYHTGSRLLGIRAAELFGAKREHGIPWIMVTFDTQFADDYKLIKKLLEAGMNVARINCAHDDPVVWGHMIELVHHASEKTGRACKIYMDIGGPKMRSRILGKGKKKKEVKVAVGDTIFLAEHGARFKRKAIVIGCDEPNVVNQLKPGERILFDDGVVESQVLSNRKGIAKIEILRVSSKKSVLRAKKGVNFPDSKISLPSLTKLDRKHIPFITQHADLMGFSFARSPEQISELQELLNSYERKPHIILKIETPQAVKNFPSLLIQGMRDNVFGVMIARGDLAVEIGFERMSEIQDEILWICEAAHAPVIWATQVLESLNKSGLATRAEVTDAAYAAKAECVMINKGDFVLDVLKSLKDILRRSGEHQTKKRYTFRPMQIARDFLATEEMTAPKEEPKSS